MAIEIDSAQNSINGGTGGIFGDISTGSASIRSFNYIQPSAEYSPTGSASSYTLSNPDLVLYSGFNMSARFLPASTGITNGLNFRALDAAGTTPRRLYYQQTFKMVASGNTNTVVEYWNDTGAAGIIDLCGGTYGVGTNAASHRGLQLHMKGGALDFSSLIMAPSLIIDTLWPITTGLIANCRTWITNSTGSTGYDWDKFNFYFDSGNMSYIIHGFT